MNPIDITRFEIEKLDALYAEIRDIQERKSENIKTERGRNGMTEMTVERDGKTFTVKEEAIWKELEYLGLQSPAAADLRAKYPVIFELEDAEQKKLVEIKDFEVKSFGFDHRSMTLPNIIRLVRGLIRCEVNADAVIPEETV